MNNQLSDFHDIYTYYTVPAWQKPMVFVPLTLLGVALLTILGYLLWRRTFKPQTAWEWALKEIEKLDVSSYKEKSQFKSFYFTLTSTIKEYLQRRFDWDTQDKTDDELATFLQLHGFNQDLLERLKTMLSGAQWIKFANETAIQTQVETDLQTAVMIIKKTIPTKK